VVVAPDPRVRNVPACSLHQLSESCSDGKALDAVEANLFSGVNVIFFASRTTYIANSAFPYLFRKILKVMSYITHS